MGQLITPSRQLIAGPRGFRKPARPRLDPNHPINRGRVGCWPLGDVANGKTADIVRGNGATFSAAQAFGANDHGGLAITFGSGNLDAATSPQYDGTTGTVTGRFKTAQSVTAVYPLLMARATSSSVSGFVLFIEANTGALRVQIRSSGSTAADFTLSSGLNDGKWHSFGLSFNQANGSTQALYLDGLKATATAAVAWSFAGEDLRWGTALDGFWAQFTGSLDNASWFNRIISDNEFALLRAEPYAGIVEAAPRWRVGSAAAGGAFNPGWAYGATKTIGGVF